MASAPSLDVRLTRSKSGNIVDIAFLGGLHRPEPPRRASAKTAPCLPIPPTCARAALTVHPSPHAQ
jgi:hypothetical protein